jgi:hypothetical protein
VRVTELKSEPTSDPSTGIIDVGGVAATTEQIAEAVSILEKDHSTNVKLPLKHRGNPLWEMDYHGISKVYYQTHPKLPPGTPHEHVAHVKKAVLHYLRKLENLSQNPVAGSAAERALATAEDEVGQEEDAERPPDDDYDARQRVRKQIVRRRGQSKFRYKLIEAYSCRCAVTGCDAEPALEAAHLLPYRGPASNTVTNGLLLRADIHTLLDLQLLAFSPQTRELVVSRLLVGTQYEKLSGIRLAEPIAKTQRAAQHALDVLWQGFTQAELERTLSDGA